MDENVKFVLRKKVERTMEALRKNRMEAYYVENSSEAVAKVVELIPDGSKVSVGGSMTLFETGVIDQLRSGRYQFDDRYALGLSPDEVGELYRRAFSSDVYLASSNAITEDGRLFNVDGNGNRVAAMIFGPKSVIIVAGINKIVPDLAAAEERLRNVAAPANTMRLHCKTPCAETGRCMDCSSPAHICCAYTVLSFQRIPGRIKVIFVGESLGY